MPGLFCGCFDQDQYPTRLQDLEQTSEAGAKIFCGMQRVRNQYHIVAPFVGFGGLCTVQVEERELHRVLAEPLACACHENLRDIAEGVDHLLRAQMRENRRRRGARPRTHLEYP